MEAASSRLAEEEDDEQGIDQQDIFDRMVLFLPALTVRLFSRVLGADDAPFRPVMGTRGDAGTLAGAAARAVRERAGASPRACSAANSPGRRTCIH
jgi:hypothetical protein